MTAIAKLDCFPLDGDYPITRTFGQFPEFYKQFGFAGHEGQDWAAPEGTPVQSCKQAKVTEAVNSGPYGVHIRTVSTDNGQTVELVYAHLSKLLVTVGQTVQPGQIIGATGNTGNSTGPHLHLTVKIMGCQTPGYPAGVVDPAPSLATIGIRSDQEAIQSTADNSLAVDAAVNKLATVIEEVNVRNESSALDPKAIIGRLPAGAQVMVESTRTIGTDAWACLSSKASIWVAMRFQREEYLRFVG
jgi:murein DD-endopeptidase MepM/ murein hydrolase activator NlpD